MSQIHSPAPDLTGASWRVSSYSGGQGDCVEVADNLPGVVPVRDSTRPAGPVIGVGRGAWQVFVAQVSRG
ncbi:DUF397 domain-containing protein [Streptomyces sp. H27-H1]|uniref:DUF397 domain-containing protein n=1 Tax=Streptomyces sp. H27-H1 TaxID=2996461 RepID=UPI00226E9BC8|nr:DUF397 domain-containing protein [Streptomyces sp. H27-H1]MCY0927568.1 DUF397 domain-containing protein [Streptomyces sp. H27-H1]